MKNECSHCTKRDHLAMSEVRQARRAVDERQANGTHRNDHAELDPVNEQLDRSDRVGLLDNSLTQREQRVFVCRGLHLDPS